MGSIKVPGRSNIPSALILGQSSSRMCALEHECWAFPGVPGQRPGRFSLLEPSCACIPERAGMTEQLQQEQGWQGDSEPAALPWMWGCVPCSHPWSHKACNKQSEEPDTFFFSLETGHCWSCAESLQRLMSFWAKSSAYFMLIQWKLEKSNNSVALLNVILLRGRSQPFWSQWQNVIDWFSL